MLGAYGGREFATPNLDRFAARALRFDTHYAGSLPACPRATTSSAARSTSSGARGAHRNLGATPITAHLRRPASTTQLISDHPHLFETGGENYHTDFTAWDYQRGHESDPWKTRPDPSWVGAARSSSRPARCPTTTRAATSATRRTSPARAPWRAAAQWLDDNAGTTTASCSSSTSSTRTNPSTRPSRTPRMYDDAWEGRTSSGRPTRAARRRDGVLDERQARQVRAQYGAKLTMIDTWFGRVLDAIDRNDLWDDTAVIVCTDHGHYLGEKDIWGKPRRRSTTRSATSR